MLLTRQAMQQGLKRIGPRSPQPLHLSSYYKSYARVTKQFGPPQGVARPDRSEGSEPDVGVSESETNLKSEAKSPLLEAGERQEEGASKAHGPLAGIATVGGIVVLLGAGFLLKDVIRDFLEFFIVAVESWGPLGYLAYALVYTSLEVLAVPAIPLTMTAGVIFGPLPGTLVTSLCGTLAATIAFLIARYAARERVLSWARRNSKFAAIDRAIAHNGFKFVTLLRLSPLFPLAVSNYMYGLTSVDLWSYVAGSWIGMLPGTYAYVSAGHLGRAALLDGEGSVGVESWQVALGLGVTLLTIGFVGRMAKTAIEEAEAEEVKEAGAGGAAGDGLRVSDSSSTTLAASVSDVANSTLGGGCGGGNGSKNDTNSVDGGGGGGGGGASRGSRGDVTGGVGDVVSVSSILGRGAGGSGSVKAS